MKINKTTWGIYFLLCTFSLIVWFSFSYPQLAFLNFSVNRNQAVTIAKEFLNENNYDISDFQVASVFGITKSPNRFLQKTIGFEGLKNFVKTQNFELFYWAIRFYKEKLKEEFHVNISSSSGEITDFQHIIDDNEARDEVDRKEARSRAKKYLEDRFQHNLEEDYSIKGDLQTILDNRSDFSFSWQKKDVSIPWGDEDDKGTGKLITSAVVSGDEILSFSKTYFIVPDQFNRYLAGKGNVARNLGTIVSILYNILFISAVFFIVVRRNHLAMHNTKRFYLTIMFISMALSLMAFANFYEDFLLHFSTTAPFRDYLWRAIARVIIGALYVSVAIMMPSLSGELLHFEQFPKKKEGSFLHYIQTTFLSRRVTEAICLGYFIFIIMLGIQSALIKFGQTYLGVWVEHSWMPYLSTAYLPFLVAFTIGFKASFTEELMYRLFAISLGKKIFKSTVAAVIVSSLIWGFAHSGYPVYPMWFRGIEVTILGIFLSFIYLRHGLITVIVAHYLFDVFWGTAEYILGQSQPFYYYSSLAVLLLPLVIALIAFIYNKKVEEKPLRWHLSKHQIHNLEILKYYLSHHRDMYQGKERAQIVKEISGHGWDLAVVEEALDDIEKQN